MRARVTIAATATGYVSVGPKSPDSVSDFGPFVVSVRALKVRALHMLKWLGLACKAIGSVQWACKPRALTHATPFACA